MRKESLHFVKFAVSTQPLNSAISTRFLSIDTDKTFHSFNFPALFLTRFYLFTLFFQSASKATAFAQRRRRRRDGKVKWSHSKKNFIWFKSVIVVASQHGSAVFLCIFFSGANITTTERRSVCGLFISSFWISTYILIL